MIGDDHSREKSLQHLFHFWLNDTPSLNGLVRILFYTLMLLVSLLSPLARPKLGDSPLQVSSLPSSDTHVTLLSLSLSLFIH